MNSPICTIRLNILVVCAVLLIAASVRDRAFAKTSEAHGETLGIVGTEPADVRSVATDGGYMVPYTVQIPGTEIRFEMIPIPGGEFLQGSPSDEANRMADEGPQVRVQVEPFWMGKCEITWAEYRAYMGNYEAFKSLNSLRSERRRFGDESEELKSLPGVKTFLQQEELDVDGVTAPTPIYDTSFTYATGEEPDEPAVTMSQFAAKQYTKWLSGITGSEYRLPSESEWEYAARAGSESAYSFGSDEKLEDFAWYAENSAEKYQAVGTKKPNAWGLHDMHGNVAEWVLDEYGKTHYSQLKDGVTALDAVRWPTKLYPRVIRGGCWFDDAGLCRNAARHKSDDPEWTLSDPNLPVSPWWFTEDPSTGVGFRIIRPLKKMDQDLKKKVWDADIDEIRQDVSDRLEEGRGTRSATNRLLPEALREMTEAGLIEE